MGHLVVDHCYHGFAVLGILLLANDDIIAIFDVVFDHRLAAHLEGEILGTSEKVADFQKDYAIDRAVVLKLGRKFARLKP